MLGYGTADPAATGFDIGGRSLNLFRGSGTTSPNILKAVPVLIGSPVVAARLAAPPRWDERPPRLECAKSARPPHAVGDAAARHRPALSFQAELSVLLNSDRSTCHRIAEPL
jgi:hypothetical protein